jgi:hypothetical protein
MTKQALIYAEAVGVIVAVSVAVHYLGGLDWPFAIAIGAATSIVARRLFRRGTRAQAPRPSGR